MNTQHQPSGELGAGQFSPHRSSTSLGWNGGVSCADRFGIEIEAVPVSKEVPVRWDDDHVTNSTGDGFTTAVVAGAGGIYLYRRIRELRRRAVNPDVQDPGPRFRLVANLLLAILGAALIALAVFAVRAWGGWGVILAVVLVLGAAIGYALGAAWIWISVEQRRQAAGYVISEAQYRSAPRQIKSSMRRIYSSAASLEGARATQAGMFGGLELQRLVYGAAERALVSAELAAALNDLTLGADSEDAATRKVANEKIQDIQNYLAEVEDTLNRSSKKAEVLSRRLAEPERQQAQRVHAEREATASADRRDRARATVEEATARAAAESDHDPASVEAKIDAVIAGYDEVVGLSGGAPDDSTPTHRSTENKDRQR